MMFEGLQLSTGRQLILASAIRGPDYHGDQAFTDALENLKMILTARIRHIPFPLGDLCGAAVNHEPLAVKDIFLLVSSIRAILSGRMSAFHYISHTRSAIIETIEHPIWGGRGPFVVKVLFPRTLMKLDAFLRNSQEYKDIMETLHAFSGPS